MNIKTLLLILSIFTYLISEDSFEVIENFNQPTQINNSYNVIETVSVKNKKKEGNNSYQNKSIKKENSSTKKRIKKVKTQKKYKKYSEKLVIIIDDISHKYQLNEIKNLGLKITPSIFPPNDMNMKNNLLAKDLKHYMVHLPLQSGSSQMNKMHKTIFVNYSKKQIEKRIREIRKLFPTAKYINNHTGSIFSENYIASKELYKALIDNGFIFVDSRTSEHTKFPRIAKELHKRYLKADFFIDNKLNVNSIINQLEKGIALAKKRGYAVLIGHPHMQTFKALKLLKGKLKSVNLVYIDEL